MKLPVFLLLEIDKGQQNVPFGDAVLYGAQMLLIGMLIVFAVLALLWLMLELLGYAMRRIPDKPAAPAPAPAATVQVSDRTTDDSELIAVLSAAVAASESAPATRFRVVSFKRK